MTEREELKCPLVSVIIPFYKYAKWLYEAIESVLVQDYRNFEIIVVNDGSDEDVESTVNKYGKQIRYFYKENGGAASARNFGIKQAFGEYVAFLDSDDLWKPNKLSMQISKMLEYNVVWSYTDFEVFGEGICTYVKQMTKKDTGVYDFVSPYIGTPTVIIKKEVLIANGLSFDEEFRYGEDSILWSSLIYKFPVLYLNDDLASVRIRGGNAGQRAAVQLRARVKVYDKCVSSIPKYKKRFSVTYKSAITLCRFGCLFVKENSKSRFNELIAKIFFLCPYLLFKIDRVFHKNR